MNIHMKRWLIIPVVLGFLLLSTTLAFAGKPYCGDGKCKGSESCSNCFQDCGPCFEPECGNNIREGVEVCDGTDLAGQDCISQDFDGGVMACETDCSDFNRDACTRDGYLEVHFIDVGQGDSILVISPDGGTLLIDTATSGAADVILDYLYAHNINTLDYMLTSHFHSDHLGGAPTVLFNVPVGVCYDRGGSYSSLAFDNYVLSAGESRTMIHRWDDIDLGTNVSATIVQIAFPGDENTMSAVLKLTYNDHDFLFGGDCTEECEASFDPDNLDFYKVHHHGSRYSSSQIFLDLSLPEVSVISVGDGNPYGHPHQEALNRITEINSQIYRTDYHGDILVKCDEWSCWMYQDPWEPSQCGNGTCDEGEDCITCSSDCIGKTNGKPSGRYCCGNGVCESIAETVDNCAIDCGS